MFGRKKKANEKLQAAEFLTGFLKHHSDTEHMKEAARASERSVVILRPQIPIGSGPSGGWFGGKAMLPDGMAWPEHEGQKLVFLGQINLAALPQDLWSGLGPRSGWLGIFLPGDGNGNVEFKPRVLHFDGALVEAAVSPLPNNAGWTRSHNFDEPQTFALPRWPFVIETQPGDTLHNSETPSLQKGPDQTSLLDPAFHPFNQKTVSLLFSALDEGVTRLAREVVRFPSMKKLFPADADWFEQQKPIILKTFVQFFEIEGRMRAKYEFTSTEIAEYIGELAQLNAYDMQYPRNDDEGYAELILRETKLLEWQPDRSDLRHWWNRYDQGLTNHALNAYTSDPTSLPEPLRTRVENKWRYDACDGLGAMGHAPIGHIYTPHGPDSPNEVLLEIHTSNLTGWIWGNCYSLVLLIKREALRRGDFNDVMFDITN